MRKNSFLTQKYITLFITAFIISKSNLCLAETKTHPTAIKTNAFAEALVKLSDHLIRQQIVKQQKVISKQSFGGYGGVTNDLKFHKETKNINKDNGQIISILQWETKKPDNLHNIVVNIYDDQGRVKRDYSASYIPVHRRAPYQTLINLHYYPNNLHSFRQFDALDEILYEQCEGTHNNKPVALTFEYFEMPESADDIKDQNLRQAYIACFQNAATTAAPYTNPLVELKTDIKADINSKWVAE